MSKRRNTKRAVLLRCKYCNKPFYGVKTYAAQLEKADAAVKAHAEGCAGRAQDPGLEAALAGRTGILRTICSAARVKGWAARPNLGAICPECRETKEKAVAMCVIDAAEKLRGKGIAS